MDVVLRCLILINFNNKMPSQLELLDKHCELIPPETTGHYSKPEKVPAILKAEHKQNKNTDGKIKSLKK